MRRFCAFITGFSFFVSGVLKLIDPVGAGLVIDEYLSFMHMSFLGVLSKPMGTMLAFAETAIGAALVTGVWRKATAIAAAAFMCFFTLLTLVLVIFNPEMDCGCFGEAIHLTHMQTFLKNIVLCMLLAGAFLPFRDLGGPKPRKYAAFGITAASMAAFTIYSLLHIPVVDFTDYRAGSFLQSAESSYSDIDGDAYEAVFIYEKDGIRKSFGLEELPDSTWTFISTEAESKEGYRDTSVPLSFFDAGGTYHDNEAAHGKVMAIAIHDPHMKAKKWVRIMKFADNAENAGFHVLMLAASSGELIGEELEDIAPDLARQIKERLFYSDYKTLITAVRSNGGAIYINDGMIAGKWSNRSLPDAEQLERLYGTEAEEIMAERTTRSSLSFQGFMLYVCAVMLLL
jgi:uncharacterized membrane protein YphA (DoxX/SURF4 family)